MTPWTTAQDELLETHAHEGVEWVRRELRRRFGVERSAEAVRVHASRLGVSLRRIEWCPVCGRPVRRLYRGTCRECHRRVMVEHERELARGLAEPDEEDPDDYREWERLRKARNRSRKSCNKQRNL